MSKVSFKHYRNLLNFSNILIDNYKGGNLIVVTNCISIVAGISFNLLRTTKQTYSVSYDVEALLSSTSTIRFLLVNSNEKTDDLEYDYFLEYTGQESNILCI